jgi:acetylglutamate kinase
VRLLIKIGGTLLDDAAQRESLARQIMAAHHAEHRIVVVHGGGRQLTRFLDDNGISSRFVNGLRVTSSDAIDAVVKVLAGTVNRQLVSALREAGGVAVGLSGLDGRLVTASQLSPELGFVGRVEKVEPRLLELLTGAGYLPAVACVAGDDKGRAWNVNADQMAAACASAFGADALIFLTDVPGVLDAGRALIRELDLDAAAALVVRGVASGGMQAKLEAASGAVRAGVASVRIVNGAAPDVIARVLAGSEEGTELRQHREAMK